MRQNLINLNPQVLTLDKRSVNEALGVIARAVNQLAGIGQNPELHGATITGATSGTRAGEVLTPRVDVASGLAMTQRGVALKPKTAGGLEMDASGVGVKAGDGLQVGASGVSVYVRTASGLVVVDGALSVLVAEETSGLTATAQGLAVKCDPAGGLQILAAGLAAKLRANYGLAVDANGLALKKQAALTPASTTHAITDPADTPASADALRDDLVANTIPAIESALNALGTALNAIITALQAAEVTA